MILDMVFADTLKAERRKRGKTQVEAAKACGISTNGLILAEGGRVGFTNRARIQRWLDNPKARPLAPRKRETK